jgi:DNA-binding NarL/FixJ family response regulator
MALRHVLQPLTHTLPASKRPSEVKIVLLVAEGTEFNSANELVKAIVEAIAERTASPAVAPRGKLSPIDARPGPPLVKLTERERLVLQLMAEGLTKKEIAAVAEISIHTVCSHLRSIYEKLEVNTNTGAVAKALRQRLI